MGRCPRNRAPIHSERPARCAPLLANAKALALVRLRKIHERSPGRDPDRIWNQGLDGPVRRPETASIGEVIRGGIVVDADEDAAGTNVALAETRPCRGARRSSRLLDVNVAPNSHLRVHEFRRRNGRSFCTPPNSRLQRGDSAERGRSHRLGKPRPSQTWKAQAKVHRRSPRKDTGSLIANYEKHGTPGYVGPNTLMEAAFGYALDIPVVLLFEPDDQPCALELIGIASLVLDGKIQKLADLWSDA